MVDFFIKRGVQKTVNEIEKEGNLVFSMIVLKNTKSKSKDRTTIDPDQLARSCRQIDLRSDERSFFSRRGGRR